MTIIEVKNRTTILINNLLEVWEDSVKATHMFLSSEQIKEIKEYVPQALKEVSHLVIIENEDRKKALATSDLYKNTERGKGLGKQLLNYGIEKYNVDELVVNEQNPNSRGFYEHLGFKVYKRSKIDEQGNPFPILYMKLEKFN